jgi:hypothetical protein
VGQQIPRVPLSELNSLPIPSESAEINEEPISLQENSNFQESSRFGVGPNVSLGGLMENSYDKDGNSRILEDITGVNGKSSMGTTRKAKEMCDAQYIPDGKENVPDYKCDTRELHEASDMHEASYMHELSDLHEASVQVGTRGSWRRFQRDKTLPRHEGKLSLISGGKREGGLSPGDSKHMNGSKKVKSDVEHNFTTPDGGLAAAVTQPRRTQ